MLDSLDIHNFQSLKSVHLELGSLTVIVGDSNCGKSALIRSIQALASNVRGSSVVTHGAKSASVSATSQGCKVTLEKGEGHGAYRVSVDGEDKEFTKLAGEVPEEVTKLLGLDPVKEGSSLNFAPQHEPPFLLTTTGSSVARTLGELTKVSTVLEAVREANRRRSSSTSDLKLRTKDLEQAEESLKVMDSLRARKAALLRVETLMAEAQKTGYDVLKLQGILEQLGKAEIEVPETVDISPLTEAFAQLKDLYTHLSKMSQLTKVAAQRQREYETVGAECEATESQLREALVELSMCPLCQQPVVT